ncbi:MAG: hypothetical protein AAF203_05430 [Pseudomonadota bacterium]
MKKLKVIVSFFILSGCSGWNSELNTPYVEDPVINEKPSCGFDLADNCWQRSMRLLADCVQPVTDNEIMGEGHETCTNKTGKMILFPEETISHLEQENFDTPIRFKVFDDYGLKRCFQFTGTQNQFVIDETEFGRLEIAKKEDGDLRVSCFFGESFTIPQKALENGCSGQQQKVGEFVPTATLGQTAQTKERDIIFSLQGLGAPILPVFHCRKSER